MPDCPRCRQPVDAQAIACPYCRTSLKAYGHPGITLHRAIGDDYLCSTCLYHADDTCDFPQRPYAKDCTLYHDQTQPVIPNKPQVKSSYTLQSTLQSWMRRYGVWMVLGTIILVSILLALSGR
jgi:Double zinc ribbon